MTVYQNPIDALPIAAREAKEICQTFNTFVLSGLTEVRIIASPQRIYSGYFTDPDQLIAAYKKIDRRDLRRAQVYFLPNPPVPALLNRAVNRFEPKPKNTTSDTDIAHRDWLLIDLDPVRPADVSATDHEHQAAIHRAAEIRDTLRAVDFTEPVIGDSGNGAHLCYRIDLANGRAETGLVQRVLEALAFKFSDQVVAVDQKTFNAVRIWKLYGTTAQKGNNTPSATPSACTPARSSGAFARCIQRVTRTAGGARAC